MSVFRLASHLRVIDGGRDELVLQCKRLGETAVTIGGHWRQGQIGPQAEGHYLRELRKKCPGVGDAILKIIGPVMFIELGSAAQEGRLHEEGLAWLAHVLSPTKRREHRDPRPEQTVLSEADLATIREEIEQIRLDMSVLPQRWTCGVDPCGHYVHIIGVPQQPTSLTPNAKGEDLPVPVYEEIDIATVYTEDAEDEALYLHLAKVICETPTRTARLLAYINHLEKQIPVAPAPGPKGPKKR